MGFFKDILKEKFNSRYKYSQGRVYLFISFVIYIIFNIYLAILGLFDKDGIIDYKVIVLVVDALQWIILLLAGYVFGGKGLEIARILFGKNKDKEEGEENLEDTV